jgi:hypothetical protein
MHQSSPFTITRQKKAKAYTEQCMFPKHQDWKPKFSKGPGNFRQNPDENPKTTLSTNVHIHVFEASPTNFHKTTLAKTNHG